MSHSRRAGLFVGQDFAAKRALRKGQQELAAFYQTRLSALESVGTRALTIMGLMISATAMLCAAIPLSFDDKYPVILAGVIGALAVIFPMIMSARAQARSVQEEYVRECRDLYSCAHGSI